uniref:Pre-mRNA-splicing factor 18 n=1 Tax=Hirondellea gigas TaxID=1518452 RepID=A0A2P2HZQ6_9CRUS
MLAALKAEIAAKKKRLLDLGVMEEGKTYFKRARLNEPEESLSSYDDGNAGSSGRVVQHSRSNNPGDSPTKDLVTGDMGQELARAEVVRRLREREQPIMVFGESETVAFRRLRRLEITEPEINRGLRNDFQEAMSNVDKAYLQELLNYQGKNESKDVHLGEAELTMEDIIELSNNLDVKDKIDGECILVMQFVELILQLWGKKLNGRPDAIKMSVLGKRNAATYNQTRGYLKPLTKRLRKRILTDDILECLVEIVNHCLQRNYVGANDSYLQMAIGNAPWPIGVTMVGIHARTGREKIFSKHVAHVLNDETQRKYIQGVKRLITKCQEYYTTVPSRCVEYKAVPF